MPRETLIADLLARADACVVLDHDNAPRSFAMRRRFGRGRAIGPLVVPDAEGAKGADRAPRRDECRPLHAHRHRLRQRPAEWLESIGLLQVDAPTTMVRGTPIATSPGGPSLFAIVTQAVG